MKPKVAGLLTPDDGGGGRLDGGGVSCRVGGRCWDG